MRNKIFTKIIITTLLVTFLTFNVGRVTRVSAVGTTIAVVAGEAIIAVGIGFLSYCALSGMAINCPDGVDNVRDWVSSIGQNVVKYPSGARAYNEIYENMINEPATELLDRTWTWTKEKLLDFANDFIDTRIISNIVGYENYLEIVPPATQFDYPFDYINLGNTLYVNGYTTTIESAYPSNTYNKLYGTGTRVLTYNANNGQAVLNPSWNIGTYRNVLKPNGTYTIQQFINGTWSQSTSFDISIHVYSIANGNLVTHLKPIGLQIYQSTSNYINILSTDSPYPLLVDEPIYVQATDETVEVIPRSNTEIVGPNWSDPNNNYRPIVPYVPTPNIPTGITPPSGYDGTPRWGFPLNDLLDLLAELGETLFDLSVLKALLNDFSGTHDNYYYLEYDNGDIHYYDYHQIANYDNDYVTYNIDISQQEDIIPVDLNTIQLYSDNRYLYQIKESAIAGSSMLRDFAVFWYDVDPVITYIALGCCILVLLGAFTGKLGHS